MTIRDERADAIRRRHYDVGIDLGSIGAPPGRALAMLLDDFDAIDTAHAEQPPMTAADLKPAPGSAAFDERTAELRGRGFGIEADSRDRLAAQERGKTPARTAPRRTSARRPKES